MFYPSDTSQLTYQVSLCCGQLSCCQLSATNTGLYETFLNTYLFSFFSKDRFTEVKFLSY